MLFYKCFKPMPVLLLATRLALRMLFMLACQVTHWLASTIIFHQKQLHWPFHPIMIFYAVLEMI